MEINVTHLSCRHVPLWSKFLHFHGASTSPKALSFKKLNKSNRFQKNPHFTTTQTSPLCRRSSTTSFSLGDNDDSGVAKKIIELDPSFAVKHRAMEISPELKGTSIFLVGMNNAMKTSVGSLLAEALRYYYFDSDKLIDQAIGAEHAAELPQERDEKGFRDSETEVLKQLSAMGRLVVCAGDGAVQSSTNLAFLRHGISIWIDIPIEMIAKEVKERGGDFPSELSTSSSNSSEVSVRLTKVYEAMRDGYAIADATISLQKVACQLGYDDMCAVTAEDMAIEVLKEIEKLTRVKKMLEAASRPF